MTAGAGYEGRVLAARYRIEAPIGAGGMGAVYRATDTRLAREVAVKLVAAQALGDPAARERLVREALACAALRHPGIVHVYDVGETDDGGAFLVMELVQGTPLRALVHDDSWTDRARLTAVVEAARALAAAHRAGLVHRDVKPDNLMLRDDGHVVLLDFGVAKMTASDVVTNLTGAGAVLGTPSYLAPEQARGRPLDARADQFALAVTAYELLARRIPWGGTSAIEVIAAILEAQAPPLQVADPALAGVAPIIERALSKKPEDRFPDLDAFADALCVAAGIAPPAAVVSAPIPASRSSGPEAFAQTALVASTPDAHARTAASPTPHVTVPSAKPRRSLGPIIAGAVLVGASAAGVGAWLQLHNPLDAAHPVLACPMLEGTLDGRPAPWLGAAASYLLADDLAPMLGGFDDHVRYPAALLQWPGYGPDARSLDPWNAPGLRERAVHAATGADEARLDGRVEVHGAQASLDVTVRTASGRVLGRARATGTPLWRAALEASRTLRAEGALGPAHPLDPDFAAWRGVSSSEELDATMDVEAVFAGGSTACHAEPPADLPAGWKRALADGCSDKPFDPATPVPALGMWDAESPSLAAPKLRERLRREVAGAPAGPRKAVLLAMILPHEDTSTEGVSSGVLAAVAAEPRAGWAGAPQGLLTADPVLVTNGIEWAPDDADWWLTATRALAPSERARASGFLQREFVLTPSGSVSGLYADSLLREGNAGEVSTVVAYLKASDDAHDRELGRLLAERAALLDGAFARTLAQWIGELSKPDAMLGELPVDSQRLTSARELAYAMSTERDVGDAVARTVAGGGVGPRLATHNATIRLSLAASCALAEPSLAHACLEALGIPAQANPIEQADWRVVREITDRYVAHDFVGAADAARRLIGSQFYPYYCVRLGDFLVDVFDRGGVPELAERIDLPHVDDRNLHGASLATLRAARREHARGDEARARALAQRVVDAWRAVDTSVPAVSEMQKLLAGE